MTFIDWELVEEKAAPLDAESSPGLHVLGATFGGVVVTEKIQELCGDGDTMEINMRGMVNYLTPDPFPNHVKTLTVLYRFQDDTALYLLNATEQHHGPIHVSRSGNPSMAIQRLDKVYKRKTYPDVEVLAVLYGPKRFQTPSVMLDLARFFAGTEEEQTPIRMHNYFFKEDPWPNSWKSWTVYFKFANSQKVQCVTGLENQALEVPWCRH